jgi:hypothetical protein
LVALNSHTRSEFRDEIGKPTTAAVLLLLGGLLPKHCVLLIIHVFLGLLLLGSILPKVVATILGNLIALLLIIHVFEFFNLKLEIFSSAGKWRESIVSFIFVVFFLLSFLGTNSML